MKKENIPNEVAKFWREYGTPNKAQCKKIAEHAIELYEQEVTFNGK